MAKFLVRKRDEIGWKRGRRKMKCKVLAKSFEQNHALILVPATSPIEINFLLFAVKPKGKKYWRTLNKGEDLNYCNLDEFKKLKKAVEKL